ncbi:MAG: YicC family protein [Xanthomonadales bacterium]|nr:YicC family protein [Xanthomonadales bacterium]
MIRSMTAFASGERTTEWGLLSCEVRAVNHRYLEPGFRLPEELRSIEPALRERLSQRLSRGKVDVSLRLRANAGQSEALVVNATLLEQLANLAQECDARFPAMQVQFTELLRYPGVLEQKEVDLPALQREALGLVDEILREFTAGREREGAATAQAMRERLDAIASITVQVRAWLPEIRAALRSKLDARLADLKQPLEPGRLEQEVVLSLQKIDVDEELDRLAAHVDEARRILGLKEAVGRRLDFLMQEFNREANTLGSKSVDQRTTQAAVELKVLIEQLREQVQNIE